MHRQILRCRVAGGERQHSGSKAAAAAGDGGLPDGLIYIALCQHRCGKVAAMKSTSVIAATFFLGLALPVGPAAADAQEPSKKTCDLLQDESLDMSTLPSGGIAITASLNGKPLTWQVDTGSDASSVTYEAARELALNPHFTNRGGAFLNNISIVQYAKLDSLGL